MMLKRYTYIILGSICLLLVGCDNFSEDERLIYDPVISETNLTSGQDDEGAKLTKRVVLLEDFTGQRCPNCPAATEVIEQLQEVCGDALVAVGIHGGPLAFAGNAKVLGLKTDTGDEYYNYWKLDHQPVGLIDRHGSSDYPKWIAAVKEELAKPAPLRLGGTASIAEGAITIQLEATGTDGTTQGKLQVWLIEDGIKTLQLMPDGTANQEYIHNHVFRTAVNGTWGEDFSVEKGETWQHTMTQALDSKWNPEQLSIVAFVYDDSGVQQTAKFQVKKEELENKKIRKFNFRKL